MNKFIVIFLLLITQFSYSQVVSDAKLRTGISVSKKINDFKFAINEEYRRTENLTLTDKMLTELEASYEFIKNVTAGFTYRFNQERNHELGGFDFNHRINFDLGYEHKINYFELSFRTRYQVGKEMNSSDKLNRNKVAIKYKLNKDFDPYLSYELFYQFNDVRAFNRTRFELGTRFKINKKNSLKFGYLYENKFNRKNLEHNHIYFINYSIEI
jgi:outer membrane receptor protein involved in Fe transport